MTNSPNFVLMGKIRDKWGEAIRGAIAGTQISEAFLAALVANESGGDPTKKRFEPHVLIHLWDVIIGREARYGNVLPADLVNYVAGLIATPVTVPRTMPANAFQKVDELATSWGLTQIMGYHTLEWLGIPGWYRTVDDLRDGAKNLKCAAYLVTIFANDFILDMTKDFSQLFHCWNAGSPSADTFDPAYVPDGMERMDLYHSLTSGKTGG